MLPLPLDGRPGVRAALGLQPLAANAPALLAALHGEKPPGTAPASGAPSSSRPDLLRDGRPPARVRSASKPGARGRSAGGRSASSARARSRPDAHSLGQGLPLLARSARPSSGSRALLADVNPLPFAPEEDGDPKEADSGLPLLASAFEGAPPTIFFDYPPEYGPKKKGNRLMLVRGMPKMFYVHTNLVHPYNAVINTLKRAGFKQTSSMVKWSLFWSAQPKPEFLRAFHPYQKTNHFPASWHLGRKDLLARHMMRMQRRWGAEYEIQPVSFVLPDEQSSFVSAKEAMSKAVWIYKPANSSCGRGIRLLTKDSKVPKKPGVVQRYVHNPLLIRGYKFDLRVYVVVTSFDPLKIYIFDELLVRLATTKYQSSTKKLSERTMHLTNYSINKHNAAYVKNQDDGAASPTRQRDLNSGLEGEEEEEEKARGGEESDEVEGEGEEEDSAPREDMASKWCIADLKAYFQENGWDFSATWERIKDLAVKTLVAVEPAIVQLLHRGTAPGEIGCQSCFELFGFDVLLDQDLKPWLLEVNVSPSLSSSSPLDRRIKTMLCADVLTLVGMRPFSAKEVEQDLQKEREARLLGQGKGGRIAQRSVTQLLETDVADFSREDWAVIQSTYEEFMRKGHLEVAYPRPENVEVYAKYFPAQRYRNVTLAKWLLRDGAEVFRRIAREGC